jgi:DNA-directed RNA polymerase specialized sigma24 family protein
VKAPAHISELHRALLARDPTAPEAVGRAVLEPLADYTERRFHSVSADITEQAALDAVWEYLQHPEQCQATTSTGVIAYLRGIARNKVLDELRRERRRHAREERWGQQRAREVVREAVELRDAVTTIDQDEDTAVLHTRQTEVLGTLDSETDRQLLKLKLSGERKTAAFAKVLAITHLPIAEQRKIVKQHKDRIDKIVRRGRGRG